MVRDDPIADVDYVEMFEFQSSPLEIVDAAVTWVEKVVQKRKKGDRKAS